MSDLAHYTVLTGNLRMSPRTEVDEGILDILKPVVRVGVGLASVRGLSIVIESHRFNSEFQSAIQRRDNWRECWVFTLGRNTRSEKMTDAGRPGRFTQLFRASFVTDKFCYQS